MPGKVNWLIALSTMDFKSTAERDEYIDRVFPDRKMSLTIPGLFYLPDGKTFTVFLDHLELWPAMCEGAQDDSGACCDGPDIKAVRARGPETNGEWITTAWCADCRAQAKAMLGFEIEGEVSK